MIWAPLVLALVTGGPAIALFMHKKAPRFAALLAGFAILCVLAGVPAFLSAIRHPVGTGWLVAVIVGVFSISATFFYLDVIRGKHKDKVAGVDPKHHHIRPLVSTAGLVLAGLMVFLNWHAVASVTGAGFTQTFSTIGNSGQA